MTLSTTVRRRLVAALALLIAAAGGTAVVPYHAGAAPLRVPGDGRDSEGGTPTLRKQLEEASKGFSEAKEKLDASKKRQEELAGRLQTLDAELNTRSAAMSDMVGRAYRTGRLSNVGALLTADDPGALLDRASALQAVTVKQDRAVRKVVETKTAEERTRQALALEIEQQEKQVTVMAKRKEQAENALKVANVSGAPSAGPAGGGSATAKPAPRNPDGSLPNESCALDDPTTTGCITARTLFAMNEAKAAGFTRFVSCFRPEGSGEHPLGRACDFSSAPGGFAGVATGGDRTYGDNLANFFVNNADRLGVLYVIWFQRIWLPGSGWRAYTQGQGDPSSEHTNHVHLSMR